jgi:hypothetical protein
MIISSDILIKYEHVGYAQSQIQIVCGPGTYARLASNCFYMHRFIGYLNINGMLQKKGN